MPKKPHTLSPASARAIWMRAQRLDETEPFGAGPEAARAAIEQLGYVQIDTINVIERCHHHILYSRIPAYQRSDLAVLQSAKKSIFEFWTHALSYVPSADLPYFIPAMKAYRENPSAWFGSVTKAEVSAMTRRLKTEGPLSIRDIDDDELVDKTHPWASRKPSKRVLQLMFYQGLVAVAAREGMVKTYDLIGRHFGWDKAPRPAGSGPPLISVNATDITNEISFAFLGATFGLLCSDLNGFPIARAVGLRRRDFRFMTQDRRAAEGLVAPAMVGMKMRADHDIDVAGFKAKRRQLPNDGLFRAENWRHHLGQSAPAGLRIGGGFGIAACVEKHVALRMPYQRGVDGQFDRVFLRRAGNEDGAAHAQPATREKMHLHVKGPLSLASSRTALTMCS